MLGLIDEVRDRQRQNGRDPFLMIGLQKQDTLLSTSQ
jgi:hypothetical protein